MPKDINWTMYAAIGTIAGSIANFCVVVVAIWQSRFSQRKKLLLKLNIAFTIETNEKFFALDIINRGNREVIIEDFSLLLRNKMMFWFRPDNCLITSNGFKAPLSFKLQIERSLNIKMGQDAFIHILQEQIKAGNLSRNDKLVFRIRDSAGMEYKIKANKTIKKYILDLLHISKH